MDKPEIEQKPADRGSLHWLGRLHNLTPEMEHENPECSDLLERWVVVEYLDHIPMGERSESDVEAISQFIHRAKCHFAKLDQRWRPSSD